MNTKPPKTNKPAKDMSWADVQNIVAQDLQVPIDVATNNIWQVYRFDIEALGVFDVHSLFGSEESFSEYIREAIQRAIARRMYQRTGRTNWRGNWSEITGNPSHQSVIFSNTDFRHHERISINFQ